MTDTTTSDPTGPDWLDTLPPEDEQSIQELIDNYGLNLGRAILEHLDAWSVERKAARLDAEQSS